jgi:hypothetical protein
MDQVALIAHRVNELARIGFKRDDLVVLSCRGLLMADTHSAVCLGRKMIHPYSN